MKLSLIAANIWKKLTLSYFISLTVLEEHGENWDYARESYIKCILTQMLMLLGVQISTDHSSHIRPILKSYYLTSPSVP